MESGSIQLELEDFSFNLCTYLDEYFTCQFDTATVKEGKEANGTKSISLTLTDNGEAGVLIGGLYTEKLKS